MYAQLNLETHEGIAAQNLDFGLAGALDYLNNEQTRLMNGSSTLPAPTDSFILPRNNFDHSGATAQPLTPSHLGMASDVLMSPTILNNVSLKDHLTSDLAWARSQGAGSSDGQTTNGSEDTHDQLNGSLKPPSAAHTKARRQTAQRALDKLGSGQMSTPTYHGAVAFAAQNSLQDPETTADTADEDDFSSDEEFMSKRTASGRSVSPRQTKGTAGSTKKKTGRPVQRKSYDASIPPNLSPDEVRRMRRILSNRESARRSRKRRAGQLSAIEDELNEAKSRVDLLTAELAQAQNRAQELDSERTRLAFELEQVKTQLQVYESQQVSTPRAAVAAAIMPPPLPALPAIATAPKTLSPQQRRATHLQSPMRQLTFHSQISHRVRFHPQPEPSFFPGEGF